jgi:hypothetical protein
MKFPAEVFPVISMLLKPKTQSCKRTEYYNMQTCAHTAISDNHYPYRKPKEQNQFA